MILELFIGVAKYLGVPFQDSRVELEPQFETCCESVFLDTSLPKNSDIFVSEMVFLDS